MCWFAALGTALGASAASATATGAMASLSIASTALSAYGQYQQGQQAEATANYNAKVAERDAQNKEIAATDAVRRGQLAEDQQRQKTRQILASQRVGLAAGGDDLSDISTQSIFGDTAAAGELDALTIRSNAAREAWGLKNDAASSIAQAQGSRIQGSAAANAGTMGAAGTVIGGAAKIYDRVSYNNLKVA